MGFDRSCLVCALDVPEIDCEACFLQFIDLPDDEDRASVAVISDKQFTVKAIFSVNSIQIFGR